MLTTYDRILRVVAAQGQRIALSDSTVTLTYREMHQRALAVAAVLAECLQSHATAKPVAGILLCRGVVQVIGILACWQCGVPYVPLDPNHPSYRIEYVVDDSGVVVILTTAAAVQLCGFDSPRCVLLDVDEIGDTTGTAPPPDAATTTLDRASGGAYIMYTSGSTGAPLPL